MDNKILEEIIRLNKDKKPFCTVSKINDDNVEIIILDKKELTDIQKLAQDALLKDQLIITNYKNEELIINPFNPPLNIIIVGAVHISQYLSKIAKLLEVMQGKEGVGMIPALLELVSALNNVDLPTLGKPTIPHLKLIN